MSSSSGSFTRGAGLAGLGEAGLWQVGARKPMEQRVVRNWPRDDYPLNIPLYNSDFLAGTRYPPSRAWTRQEQLCAWRDVYRGDYSHYILDATAVRVNVNYVRRLIDVMVALLMSTNPPLELADSLQTALTEMMIGGRAHLGRFGDMALTPHSENAWISADIEGALHIVSEFVSGESTDGQYDRAAIYTLPDEPGPASCTQVAMKHGQITEVLETVNEEGVWAAASRPPVLDEWGSSMVEDLIPIVVSLAVQLTNAEHVVLKHASPTIVMGGAPAEMAKLTALDGEDQTPDGVSRSEIQARAQRLTDSDVVWVTDNLTNPTVLSWDGQLAAAFMLIDTLKDEMRMMSGLPGILDSTDYGSLSGVAIRELFGPLTWTAGQLQPRMYEAAEHVFGAFEWANPFDEEPEPEPVEEVPDQDPEMDEEGGDDDI